MRTSFAAALALATPNAAFACGGFFCDTTAPVDQTGETILFGVDHAEQKVEMHVQVDYVGPSQEFAWVLPVKGEPDVFLSHSALFEQVPAALPTFFRIDGDDSRCDRFDSAQSGAGGGSSAPSDVTVLSEQLVGAYEVTILAADDADTLVAWLQEHAYDVPDALGDVLVPYVANGMNFMALKLRNGTPEGELSPLALRYEGLVPTIPIELTSIAASPDMPLIVYLFGDARAVPLNYRHVQINPVAVDYWRGGANFDDAIGLAADEAGGHAFATDLVSETGPLRKLVYQDGQFDLDRIDMTDVAAAFVESLRGAGFGFTDEVMTVLRRHAPMPADFGSEDEFYGCPECYPEAWAGIRLDPDQVVAELVELEVEPRQSGQALLDRFGLVTRLRSSISPVEMTVDPQFGFNPDLPMPPDLSTLEATVLCTAFEGDPWSADQHLVYPLGFEVTIPSRNALSDMGMTEFEYVQTVAPPAALRIEQLGESGQGEVLVDNGPDLIDALADIDLAVDKDGSTTAEAGGCGCATASPVGAVGLLLPLLAVVRRR